MLYERKTNWVMFMMVGASYAAFEIEKQRNEKIKAWRGELLYVGKDGKAFWKKTLAPV